MEQTRKNNGFDIEALVDDLQPVKPLIGKRGLIYPLIIAAFAIFVNTSILGLRPDLIAGKPAEMFLIRAGLLLLLGLSSAHAVISMASPSVGKQNNGWKMAAAGAFLFPLSAIIVAMTGGTAPSASVMLNGVECLIMSVIGALATAIPIIYWLRKGAPTSLERVGWLTGIASGGLGAFAYNFHCTENSIIYIGFWYGLSVGISALIGRLVVPRLIRW